MSANQPALGVPSDLNFVASHRDTSEKPSLRKAGLVSNNLRILTGGCSAGSESSLSVHQASQHSRKTSKEKALIHCSLFRLPPEAIWAILETAVMIHTDRRERDRVRLNLMATCRQLRRAMLDVPSSIDVESLSAGTISLSLYSLQERTTARPFDFRFYLPEVTWLFLPTCAGLSDDPDITSCFIKHPRTRHLTSNAPDFMDTRKQALGIALVKRKALIRTLDITGQVEKMPKWSQVASGDLPNLQRLRLWSENHHPTHFLPLKAGRLTILILNRFIPPPERFPCLQRLVVHGLSERDWPYDHILDFLSKAQRLEHLDFDGHCLPEFTGTSSRTVALQALQKAVFGADPAHVSNFLRNLNLNIQKLSLEFTVGAFWPNVELTTISGQYLDQIDNVVIGERTDDNVIVRLSQRTMFIYSLGCLGETPLRSRINIFFEATPSQVGLQHVLRYFPNFSSVHTYVAHDDFEGWRLRMADILLDDLRKVILYNDTGAPVLGLESATFVKGKVALPTAL